VEFIVGSDIGAILIIERRAPGVANKKALWNPPRPTGLDLPIPELKT
jgi:hypothetical protein